MFTIRCLGTYTVITIQYTLRYLRKRKKENSNDKELTLLLKSLSPSISSILSCTYETKSLKTNIVLFSALIYRKYLPSIYELVSTLLREMAVFIVNRCVQGRLIPNNTSGSERSIFPLHTLEYQFWNLFQKEDAYRQRMTYVQVSSINILFYKLLYLPHK